ncbi:MAG: hypothetical protein ACK4WD_04925 [Flavobacteriales bacterium]|jgi:hypothetical protein
MKNLKERLGMNNINKLLLILAILFALYVGLSYLLLDGRIINITTFNEDDIESSKESQLLISDNLEISVQGDSLVDYNEVFNIWVNKRYSVRHFGFLFYWTFIEDGDRFLNIKKTEKGYESTKYWCIVQNDGLTDVNQSFACHAGDTIYIDVVKCKTQDKIGQLKIVVE